MSKSAWLGVALAVAQIAIVAVMWAVAYRLEFSGRSAACPDGYVSVFRTTGQPACAAYVVEPVR